MSKKIIVILDDDEMRHEYFDARFAFMNESHHLIHCRTANEFYLTMLSGIIPYAVFLDHDLSTEAIMCDPTEHFDEETGSDVARWLILNWPDPGLNILIHSMNPVGAAYMRDTFLTAGFTNVLVRPFFQIMEYGMGVSR